MKIRRGQKNGDMDIRKGQEIKEGGGGKFKSWGNRGKWRELENKKRNEGIVKIRIVKSLGIRSLEKNFIVMCILNVVLFSQFRVGRSGLRSR